MIPEAGCYHQHLSGILFITQRNLLFLLTFLLICAQELFLIPDR